MLLIYYRLYLTQEFLILLFKHQHKSSISRNIKQMRDLFERVLPTHAKALERVLRLATKEADRRGKRISSIEEFKEAYPELTFIIDGVEQEKRKPQNKQKRKSDYSREASRVIPASRLSSQRPVALSFRKAPQAADALTTSKPSKKTTVCKLCVRSSARTK